MAPAETWERPSTFPPLLPDEVHVWRVSLREQLDSPADYRQILSSDELERADRFLLSEHGERFVATRGILRVLLGRYLAKSPHDFTFCYNDQGKPSLLAFADSNVEFNLAHSGDFAFYAFSIGRRLGTDVEGGDREVAYEKVSRRFFSQREVADMDSLPAEDRRAAFFTCWTRKEAYLKAIGTGLSAGLAGFSVSLKPGEPARLVEVKADESEAQRWRMENLTAGEGYAAALCVQGEDWQLRCFDGVPNPV